MVAVLSRKTARVRSAGTPLFPLAVLSLLLALGGLVRVSAMPVEARTQETWYAYMHEIDYDFAARVVPGLIYESDLVRGQDLIRQRVPVEPPAYRRVLVPRLLERLTLSFPYTFTADRPGEITAVYRVDAVLSAPGYWQKSMPLVAPTTVRSTGTTLEIPGFGAEVPVKQILADMERLQTEQRLTYDQLELRVRPVVSVSVAGQKEPVETELSPELMLYFRSREVALEVEEPRIIRGEQTFSTTTVVPMTVQVLGRPVRVATLRLLSTALLVAFAVLLAVLGILRWLKRRALAADDLRHLGGALLTAGAVEYPPGVVIVEVQSVHQLISLHLQTHRPVVQVGEECYIIDGTVCYRLRLRQAAM